MCRRLVFFSAACIACLWVVPGIRAQYVLPYDTMKSKRDTTVEEPDTSATPDTLEINDESVPLLDTAIVKPRKPQPKEAHADQIGLASLWVRRLLYRGWLDTSHIGAFARYQLTSWEEGIGSYGPVEAQYTVYYLGPTAWMKKDAEWLQVAVQTMGDDPVLIEYDLIVPSKQKIDDVYRVLYRVDRGPVRSGNFNLSEGTLDYDRSDEPIEEGLQDLEFYSGTYQTQLYHGSGVDAADVYIYRADKMPPFGIVVLGYGDEGLTFMSSGTDAAPRFYVPPPPGR